MNKLTGIILLAVLLWTLMFSPWTAPYIPFWWMMTASALTLSLLAGYFGPPWWKDLNWKFSNLLSGIGIAALLWGIFWLGNKIAVYLFDFAQPQIALIYGMKHGQSSWLLIVLMLFLIGPAEEIVWRGYIQRSLSERWSPNTGFITATLLYSLVHVPSLNIMLILAAAVAGTVWGLFYRFFPDKLISLIISHALWDVAVFILFPI